LASRAVIPKEATVTGSAETHRTNPAVPVTPEQIATAALDAERARASIVHIHVRDSETGKASGGPSCAAWTSAR
jgi:3-dehydrocarnitine:acetyl-CoA trimethylamine transferase